MNTKDVGCIYYCCFLHDLLQTSDLSAVFKESSHTTPLIFILSPGTDPAADLYKFADLMQFSKKMSAISLGQGQVREFPFLNSPPIQVCVDLSFGSELKLKRVGPLNYSK